jgi:hypothetical protein
MPIFSVFVFNFLVLKLRFNGFVYFRVFFVNFFLLRLLGLGRRDNLRSALCVFFVFAIIVFGKGRRRTKDPSED